jgi:hypothetical protein
MLRRGLMGKPKKIFSLTVTVMLVLSSLLIGISTQMPKAAAASKSHTVGNVDIQYLMDWGRVLNYISWNGERQTVNDPAKAGMGFIGLVIDHDYYDHTPGYENISDSFKDQWAYASSDDFKAVTAIDWLIDDPTTEKSFCSFQNKGVSTGYIDDILVNQTAWTVVDKDWAIIQWSLLNLKGVPLTDVSIGLELPLSFEGKDGVGGDGGDDIDGFDATNYTYWAQDNDTKTTIGFASAIITEPITHYHSVDYGLAYTFDEYKYFYENDTFLYGRLHAPNATVGTIPGNRTSTVGWDNFTINPGSVKTFTLVIAVNDSLDNMTAAVQDAQFYYDFVASGFRITEFNDMDSGSGNQYIEVYNQGKGATDLYAAGYRIFVDGTELTQDSLSWNPNPLPTYEHSIFTLDSTENIPAEGGTIGLYYYDGGSYILVDEVSYGQKGLAPDPVNLESVAIRYDFSKVEYSNDWLRNASSGPTWGAQNNVGTIASPNIVINRVEFNPWVQEESYVELMWTSGSGNIMDYKIVCDDVYVVPSGTPDLGVANRFFVLNQSNFPLNFDMDDGLSNGDNIYLYDANDNLLDMVGWSTAHDPGTYMSRVPDGNGTFQGFNDTTSEVEGWVFNNQPTLQITEFHADSGSADIEIYNHRGGDIVPTNGHWRLEVNSGELTGGWTPDPIPGNRGYSMFSWDGGGGGTPWDEGDTISLYYNNGSAWVTIDQVGYGTNGTAPDPLTSGSSGRYWNSSLYAYTNDWNRNASAPTWGYQNDVPPIVSSAIVMNEIMFDPSADPDGHFFVIFNTGPIDVDLTGWQIVCDEIYTFTGTAEGYYMYIFRYWDVTATHNMFNSMDATGDNVYLYDNLGQRIDMVGWNAGHFTGMSVKRIPDGFGTPDGYNDTTSEAAGWVFNTPLEVYLTEISDSQGTSQIEIYNSWYPTINFSAVSAGYSFDNRTGGITGTWFTPEANASEYAVFDVDPGLLHHEGDMISFYQNGYLIDEIGYGLYGTVPDPLAGESVERYWNWQWSAYTNVWERNYTTGPNFGFENDVPSDNLTSPIILNEVLFYPLAAGDSFVEIYNIGGAPINISGFKIVCDTEYTIPIGTELDFNERFFYLLQGMDPGFFEDPVNMTSTGDNVYLYDANGSLVDMVGWNSQHTQGGSAVRVPDGNGTRDGYDDVTSVAAGWQFDSTPTVHLVSIVTTDGRKPVKFGHYENYLHFNLTITNLQGVSDIIDILNISQEGWIAEIYDETGTVKITNVTLNPDGSVNIVVNVTMPDSIPFAAIENITITIRSTTSQIIGDSIVLTAKVYPFLNLTKSASPYEINMNGTGYDEITKITLNCTGLGAQVAERRYLDCVFCIDSSGSMLTTDPSGLRITESQNFVANHFEYPDRGAVVEFDTDADLLPPGHPPGDPLGFPGDHLDTNYSKIIVNLGLIDAEGGTVVSTGLNLSNEELRTEGDPTHVPIIILITDAQNNDPNDNNICINEANIAASRGVIIFTIGLMIAPGSQFELLLMDIASITGGMYFAAPDAGFFASIYENISQFLNDIAVWVPPGDPNPMVRDVLPPGIEVVGNFTYPPSNIYVDPMTNETIIEWDLEWIRLGETFSVTFEIKSNIPGRVYTNVYNKSRAYYTRWDNTTDEVNFPLTWVFVIPPEPFPPKLYIDISADKNDILLYWDEPLSPGTDHYLIYRATDPMGFDFSTPWVNTSSDIDPNGPGWPVPDRLEWNHTGAADLLDPEYAEQWYYCIRSVNALDETSCTSRTVGKWTKEFTLGGVSTFSLPLEPLEVMNTTADFYLTDMNADYVKWMDPMTHVWNKHGDGGVNDTQLEVGKGYEVRFGSPTKYTFMGMPGAMIRYNTGSFLGFDYNSDAKSVSAAVNPISGDVTITWSATSDLSTVQYHVYYSTTRDGFHGTRGVDYILLAMTPFGTEIAVHPNAVLPAIHTQFYYMVIPLNATDAEGATTYSIGVWTAIYLAEYDTMGVPLLLTSYPTADWYCDADNVVGINYFIDSNQRWSWHSERMPQGAFDPQLLMAEGYQISTSNITRYTFIGI